MLRHFTTDEFRRVSEDCRRVFPIIAQSYGYLDFRIRDHRFNIYAWGRNISEVRFMPANDYEIRISSEYHPDKTLRAADVTRFPFTHSGKSLVFRVNRRHLSSFLCKSRLEKLARHAWNYSAGDELYAGHAIIMDNYDCSRRVCIDREVTETGLKGRIDLLYLCSNGDNTCSFEALELKLGNNKELRGPVEEQVDKYAKHMNNISDQWAESYFRTYTQLRDLGLIPKTAPTCERICGHPSVKLVVVGYPHQAKPYLQAISRRRPDLDVRYLSHHLE